MWSGRGSAGRPLFDRIEQRLQDTRYGSFELKNCLVFKITDILPVSLLKKASQE